MQIPFLEISKIVQFTLIVAMELLMASGSCQTIDSVHKELSVAEYETDLEKILRSNPDRLKLKNVLIELVHQILSYEYTVPVPGRVSPSQLEISADDRSSRPYQEVEMPHLCYLLKQLCSWEELDDVFSPYAYADMPGRIVPPHPQVIQMLADSCSEKAYAAFKKACDIAIKNLEAFTKEMEVAREEPTPENSGDVENYCMGVIYIANGLSGATNPKSIPWGEEIRRRVEEVVAPIDGWGRLFLEEWDSCLVREGHEKHRVKGDSADVVQANQQKKGAEVQKGDGVHDDPQRFGKKTIVVAVLLALAVLLGSLSIRKVLRK